MRPLLIGGRINNAPAGEHMIRLMSMSDIYVEYEVSSTTCSACVIRIFAKVPRAKIEAYRQAQNDPYLYRHRYAHNLSELPALSSLDSSPSLAEFGQLSGRTPRRTARM